MVSVEDSVSISSRGEFHQEVLRFEGRNPVVPMLDRKEFLKKHANLPTGDRRASATNHRDQGAGREPRLCGINLLCTRNDANLRARTP